MTSAVHPKDRLAVIAAYLSPLYGLPLLGPWLLAAVIPADSTARPHVMRAFDLHLAAVVSCFVLAVGTLFLGESVVIVVVGGVLVFFTLADLLLLALAIRGTSLTLWEPVVLGRRRFYRQEPFTG
ncbi:hypothetical protein [Aeromicrobium sp. 9AM]|uniref:hypothetical protein n=1 Tax=Aeromicrobium sp. 9AM TaxID=2653126 RepID=UPI0012F0EA08|nr:hypothetical protein [Aeromicrobium sp. 9AM]VXC05730.1 membrane hypothetical protein [Aeromicrobium sp. 9AM]